MSTTTTVEKTYKIVKRNGKWMPALISKETGKVLKLFRELADEDKEVVESAASNKAICFLFWQEGITEVEDLHQAVDGAVKQTTIRSWLSGWSSGRNLPAIAIKD